MTCADLLPGRRSPALGAMKTAAFRPSASESELLPARIDAAAGAGLQQAMSSRRDKRASCGVFRHAARTSYFWGDLDREGLRIAMALRRIPQLDFSGFYVPMVEMARNPATLAGAFSWTIRSREELCQGS